MDRNVKILIIFILLLFLYDTLCNNKIVEASTDSPAPIVNRNDGVTIDSASLLNSARNSF